MKIFFEIKQKIGFWLTADRIGPDIPFTQFPLYFPTRMTKLCKKKFKYFGDKAEIRPGAYIDACSKISIGKNVVIRPGTFLYADPTIDGGGIVIEDDVLIGPGVHFYTNNHEFSDTAKSILRQGYPIATPENRILVKKGSWIGANSVILPGVEIGENSVVGAGSVVTKNVPARVVVAGNPTRIIKAL